MHLFQLNDFGMRYGIDLSVSDFKDVVTAASSAATKTIASRFRYTDFETRTTRRDMFRVSRSLGAGGNQHTTLRLSRGFIEDNSTFAAYYTASPLHFRNNDTDLLTDLERVNSDAESNYLLTDFERGVLSVFTLDLTDQWVVCEYDCGFAVSDTQEYTGVPEWLSEAAMSQAALYVKQNRAFQSEGEDDTSPLTDSLNHLFASHGRYMPSAILATMSEQG